MGRGEGGTRTSVLPAHFGNFAASKLAIGARDCRSDAARRKSRKHRHSCQDNSRGTPDIFAILRASPPGYDHVTGVAQNEADPPRLTVQYEKKASRRSPARTKENQRNWPGKNPVGAAGRSQNAGRIAARA